jgi:hypothetical protein
MDGMKDSACTKKHCSDGKESRIGLTGACPLQALPIVRPDVLARRRQCQREFTSEFADQEENSIFANSPKLICTDSDDYSMEPPSKILCGNPYGGIKKVEVASPRGLFKTTMPPTWLSRGHFQTGGRTDGRTDGRTIGRWPQGRP